MGYSNLTDPNYRLKTNSLGKVVDIIAPSGLGSSFALTPAQQANLLIKAPAGVGNGRLYDENGREVQISSSVYGTGVRGVGPGHVCESTGGINSIQTRYTIVLADTEPFQINYANWYCTTSGTELNGSGNLTVFASWEYPIGTTPTQITWNGQSSVVILPGDDSPLSDPITNVPPVGKAGILCTYFITSGGTIHFHQGLNPNIGESTIYGNNITNQTLVPSTTPFTGGSTLNNQGIGPLNIVATTSKPAIMELGDSRRVGIGDTANGYNHAIGQAQRQYVAKGLGYLSAACGNTRASQFVANSAKRRRSAQYYTHIDCGLGINDTVNGRTNTQIIADLVNIRNLTEFVNKPFGISTLPPRVTSTDSYITTANQTPVTGESERLLFNTKVRSGLAGGNSFQYFSDYAALVESAYASGKWQVGPNPYAIGGETPAQAVANYLTADGVHETSVGYNLYLKNKVSYIWGI